MSNRGISLSLPPWLAGRGIDLPRADVIVSFVRYGQSPEECDRAISLALRSVLAVHVVVINNGGGSAPTKYGADPRVTIVNSPRNLGYGRAHNLAIALGAGRSDYHLVANTDLEFDGDPISKLIGTMKEDIDVGLVAPGIVYPDGRHQPNARLLPSPRHLLAKRLPNLTRKTRALRNAFLLDGQLGDRPVEVPFVTGPFMLFRRSILERLDGFDPRFFVYGEDVDLSRRAHAISKTLYIPAVQVTHFFRSEAQPSLWRFFLLASGYARYFNKWGWFRDPERDDINRATLGKLLDPARSPPMPD